MDSGSLLPFLGSSAAITFVGLVINAIVNRRKLGAEATKVITDAAASVVGSYRADNADLRIRVADLVAAVTRLETKEDRFDDERKAWARERRQLRAELAARREWEQIVVGIIRSVIPPIHLPDPPPASQDHSHQENS